MKILFLTEFFPKEIGKTFTGGVEARVYYLAKYLKSRGHTITVVSRTHEYAANSIKTLLDRVFYFVTQLTKIVAGRVPRADIIEGTNFSTYVLSYLWAKKVGAKSVAWWPDVFGDKAIENLGLASGLSVRLIEIIAGRLPWDKIIALSNTTKKKLVKMGIDEGAIKVVYGGVDGDLKQQNIDGRKQKFGDPTIICISRLVNYKRIVDLILAIYIIKQKMPSIKLLVIGDGPERENLKFEIRNLKLDKQVEMLGRISEEDKWEYLSRSWIHVLPSGVEGFGLVTMEALMAGTPVVNTDIPINKEILGDLENNGRLLFKLGDYVDLAEKIEQLLADKGFYERLIQKGKELVKKYDWEKVNRETERIYECLLPD